MLNTKILRGPAPNELEIQLDSRMGMVNKFEISEQSSAPDFF